MDPEDVLDFGEDDDGLDVISLGVSDHNGEPVPTHPSSVPSVPAPRSTRPPNSPSPLPNPGSKPSSSTRLPNGTDRSLRQPDLKPTSQPKTDAPERPEQPIERFSRSGDHASANIDRRPHDIPSRVTDRSPVTESCGNKRPVERPKPGERASYMPPDRLQAIAAAASRSGDASQARVESRRALASGPPRLPNHHGTNPSEQAPLPSPKTAARPEKSSAANDGAAAPESSKVERGIPELPEGWIVRTSGAGKTYYVNSITRTSQWALPTEPAARKVSKPNAQLPSKVTSSRAAASATVSSTDIHRASDGNNNVVDLASSPRVAVNRPQAPIDLAQACASSQPSSIPLSPSLRPPSAKASPIELALPRPKDSPRHETVKLPHDGDERKSGQVAFQSAPADTNIDSRSGRQDRPPSATSVNHSRDHRIHPDRLKEIRQDVHEPASYRPRDRAPDDAKATPPGSFHRDAPPHQAGRMSDGFRRGGASRYPQEPDSHRPRMHPRPHSLSPEPRRAEPPSYVIDRVAPSREAIYSSGANGIPTGSSRTFSGERTLKHPASPRHVESPRHEVLRPATAMTVDSADLRHTAARRFTHSSTRDMPHLDHGPYDGTRRESVRLSPAHPLNRQRHDRARSSSPPPRWPPPLADAVDRESLYREFPPDRARVYSGPGRFPDERPLKHAGPIDPVRYDHLPRYDAYRPASFAPAEADGSRRHEPRRGAVYPPPPAMHRLGPSHLITSRPRGMPPLSAPMTESPKPPKDLAQPDLYRPSHRGVYPARIPARDSQVSRYGQVIDIEESLNGKEIYPRHQFDRRADLHPSPRGRPTDLQLALPLSPRKSDSFRNVDQHESIHTPMPPPELAPRMVERIDRSQPIPEPLPARDVERNGRKRGAKSTSEADALSEKGTEASVEIVDLTQFASGQAASSPKNTPSLAHRLGPVVCGGDETDLRAPPAKKHRANPSGPPVEVMLIEDSPDRRSQDVIMAHEVAPDSEAPSSPKKPPAQIESSSAADAQVILIDERPESLSRASPPRVREKGFSVRGRAARQAEQPPATGEVPIKPLVSVMLIEEESSLNVMSAGNESSLRDRIQNVQLPPPSARGGSGAHFSPGSRARRSPRGPKHERSNDNSGHRPWTRPVDESGPSAVEPPPTRHISERISGLGGSRGGQRGGGHQSSSYMATMAHDGVNGNHHQHQHVRKHQQQQQHQGGQFVGRTSDSGWSGRKARYP